MRPKAETFHGGYAVGHITTAISYGHKIRLSKKDKNDKTYKASFTQTKTKVPGKRFYDKTAEIDAIIYAESERLADEIVTAMEGDA